MSFSVRTSGIFAVKRRPAPVTAAWLEESVAALDPTARVIVTLNVSPTSEPEDPSLCASERVILDTPERHLIQDWLMRLDRTRVVLLPRALRRPLCAFRALCSPVQSPATRFGAVLLTRPAGESCPLDLKNKLEGLCCEWALALEEEERQLLRGVRKASLVPGPVFASWNSSAAQG